MAYEQEDRALVGAERAIVDHRPPTVTERLRQERVELHKRLTEIDELLATLEGNPQTQDILDRLAVLGFHRYIG